MYQCPNCNEYTFDQSTYRKITFINSKSCSVCQVKVTKPYWSVVFKYLKFCIPAAVLRFKLNFIIFFLISMMSVLFITYVENQVTPLSKQWYSNEEELQMYGHGIIILALIILGFYLLYLSGYKVFH